MAAEEDNSEEEMEQILYDLLVHAEWQLEAEPLVIYLTFFGVIFSG